MIRPLHTDDFYEAIRCWNDSAPFDPMTAELFRENVPEDEGYLPETGWLDEGEEGIRGLAVGVLRQNEGAVRGHIKFLAVRRGFRRRRIATELLERVEDRLRAHGAAEIRIGESAPNYHTPGVDIRYAPAVHCFEKCGYRIVGEAYNQDVILGRGEEHPDEVLPPFDVRNLERSLAEMEFTRAVDGDLGKVRKLLEEHWRAWIPEVERTFRNVPISLHIATERDRIVAFSAYDGNNVGTGTFGPMGTDPAYRSRGIGEVLLKRCLNDLHRQGHRRAIIPWVGPLGFYSETVGATISRVFARMEKRFRVE